MKVLICLVLCVVVGGAGWTDTPPKTYPDRAKWLLQRAEEVKRNIDPNDLMWKVADDYTKRANKYLRYPRADVNRDGIVDMNDLAKVSEYLGNSAQEVRLNDL